MGIWIQFDVFDDLIDQLRLDHNDRPILLVSKLYSEVIGDVSLIFYSKFCLS